MSFNTQLCFVIMTEFYLSCAVLVTQFVLSIRGFGSVPWLMSFQELFLFS